MTALDVAGSDKAVAELRRRKARTGIGRPGGDEPHYLR
jgi:hypothetical protein